MLIYSLKTLQHVLLIFCKNIFFYSRELLEAPIFRLRLTHARHRIIDVVRRRPCGRGSPGPLSHPRAVHVVDVRPRGERRVERFRVLGLRQHRPEELQPRDVLRHRLCGSRRPICGRPMSLSTARVTWSACIWSRSVDGVPPPPPPPPPPRPTPPPPPPLPLRLAIASTSSLRKCSGDRTTSVYTSEHRCARSCSGPARHRVRCSPSIASASRTPRRTSANSTNRRRRRSVVTPRPARERVVQPQQPRCTTTSSKRVARASWAASPRFPRNVVTDGAACRYFFPPPYGRTRQTARPPQDGVVFLGPGGFDDALCVFFPEPFMYDALYVRRFI